jgi:hypothetical protein
LLGIATAATEALAAATVAAAPAQAAPYAADDAAEQHKPSDENDGVQR